MGRIRKPAFQAPRYPYSSHHAGHSRTLYTSIAPEQSNIILKNESRERTTLSRKRPIRHAGSALLPGFQIGRNQTNFVDAGKAHEVDGPGDVGKAHGIVTFHEGDFLGALFENIGKART
jgi:hypothetical protein